MSEKLCNFMVERHFTSMRDEEENNANHVCSPYCKTVCTLKDHDAFPYKNECDGEACLLIKSLRRN